MADFSIQEAAFTGFSLVRKHRDYLGVWTGLALVVSLLLTVAIIVTSGPAMMSLQSVTVSASHDPAIVASLLSQLAPLFIFLIPAIVVFYGVLYAAMNRAVLRPADHRFAYLAFGADELRQIALLFLGLVVFSVVYFVLVFGLAAVASLIDAVTKTSPVVAGSFAGLFAFAAMIWLAVRLSLASALTFERRRVTLFASWALTKGRFWPIFGTYILVLALGATVLLLTYLVILAIVAVATGGNLAAALAPPDMRSLSAYFTLAHILQIVLDAGVSALLWPVVLSPPAAILRQISVADGHGRVARVPN